MATQIRTIDFLPEIFQTQTNELFLNATLDQLVQQPDFKKVQGFIGSKYGYGISSTDQYLIEPNTTRANYQLEPAVVFKKKDTSIAVDMITYPGLVNAIELESGIKTNHNKLFSNEFYSWDSFTDLDKLINFGQYYWVPQGPEAVSISTEKLLTKALFTVNSLTNSYEFVVNGGTSSVGNPTIELVRGGTYTFVVNQTSPFYIQTQPGLDGFDAIKTNFSTRQIYGVENNGSTSQSVVFNVPQAADQTYKFAPSDIFADLVTEKAFNDIHHRYLSEVVSIDGVTLLEGKTLLFYGTDPKATSSFTNATINKYLYKIRYVGSSTNPMIELDPYELLVDNTKITIQSGHDYISRVFVKDSQANINLIPIITSTLDTLYYQDGTNPAKFGKIKIVDDPVSSKIDVLQDILGKKTYTSPNGITFTNGLKVQFTGQVFPLEYLNDTYYVEGVGHGITLIPVSEQIVPEPFGETTSELFESHWFDQDLFESSAQLSFYPDYITINRGSMDRNAWTRSNSWFHVDVLKLTVANNTLSPIASAALASNDARAKRPIIEFYPNLKLINHGQKGRKPIDFIDKKTPDALSMVAGSTDYYPDGQHSQLFDGARIIFTNDSNIEVRNKIFIVKISPINGVKTITLSVANDGNLSYLDQVFVLRGDSKGTSYYFDGNDWLYAQQKNFINQPPLFDIFDSNNISFSDSSYYAGTDFTGCTLFQYATGTGPVDPILKFAVSYGSVGNISDIAFDVTLNNQIFNYVINNVSTPQAVNTGYVYSIDNAGNPNRHIGWVTAAERSFQYQVFNYVYDTTTMLNGPVFVTDVAMKDTTSTLWPTLIVYVDNVRLDSIGYSVFTTATTTSITLKNSIPNNTHVDVMIYSDQVSTLGYFQVPSNLDHNPFNTPVASLNLGDIRGHYKSICNNLSLTGSAFGANNYRDLGDVTQFGTKIIQNSATLATAAAFIRKQNTNFFNSILYNSTEYVKFKALLINTVNNQNFTPYDTPASMFDTVMDIITSVKTSTNSFFWSDMLPSKTPKYTRSYKFNIGIPNTIFPTNIYHDFKNANYNGLLLYVVRNVSGLPQQTIQLYKEIDYIVPDGQNYVEVTLQLQNNDVVVVNEYDQTYGSYIPSTPTKVGFFPLHIPEVILDSTYSVPTFFIKGHDGSYTKLYGEYNNGFLEDFRDKVLYEFEMRVYNNMKVDAKLPLELDDIKPGQFRTTDYSYDEFMTIYSTSFLNWVGLNRVNYNEQYYDSTDDFTWNYNSTVNTLGNTQFKQGNWRGIYLWLYDTANPDTKPWEMLGLANKPSWWDMRYGPMPYTSDNELLWADLSNGYIWNNGSPYINSKRVRPNLMDIIPVDKQGNLLSPFGQYTNKQLIGTYNTKTFNNNWIVGDVGPTEYSYLKSSAWPFDLMRIFAVTKPAQFFTLGLDLDVYKYSTEFSQYLVYNRLRTPPTALQIYGAGANGPASQYSEYAQHSYFNWVVDYLQQFGLDGSSEIYDLVSSLDVRLAYRLAGFSDKNQLSFFVEKGSPNSKNNALLIPDDSYNLVLYKNEPDDVIVYSSVIVQKTSSGFKVYGNSQNKAYFLTYDPLQNNNFTPIIVDKTAVNVPIDYTNNVTVISYGHEFANIQSLAVFLTSYGYYLTSQGMQFTDIENGIEISWNQMVAEMLYWYNTGWEIGSTINLNPNANIITVDNTLSVVQPLTDYNENYILNQNLVQVQLKNLSIYRKDTQFSAKALTQGDSLSFFRAILSNVEHAVIFDNETVFNDTIFNLVTGLRQQRLYLKGTKTNNWNGTLNAPGFIINQDNVTDWQPHQKYVKGDIVLYKRQYWMANVNVVIPKVEFNTKEWILTQYQDIHKGLVPNPSTRAYESELYYNTSKSNLESDGDVLGYSLIGYRPRAYLADANLDDPSQVNLFKTMIKGKGTLDTLNALKNIELQGHEFSYNVYENWAIKNTEYGGILNSNFVEFTLDESLLTGNPSIVSIVNGNGVSYAQQQIALSNIVNYGRSLTSSDVLPALTTEPSGKLASAGYVHMDDVALLAYTTQRLNPLSIYSLYGDDYIWIADKNNDWGIYSVVGLQNTITSVANNFNNTVTIQFKTPHGLTTDDIIGISFYNPLVDGYYTVSSVASNKSITVSLSLSNTITTIPVIGSALVVKLQSQRIGSALDINSLPQSYEYLNNYVWMDKGKNNDWLVYEKSLNYKHTNFISSIENDVNVTYGSQVAYIPDVGFYITDAGNGKLYKYVETDTGFAKTDTVTHLPPFGQTMVRSDKFLAIASPDPTLSQIHIYRIVQQPEVEALVEEQILSFAFGIPVGSTLEFSGDSNFLFISVPGLDLSQAGGGAGAILVYKRSPYYTYLNPYPTLPLANTTLTNEKYFVLKGDQRTTIEPGKRATFFHYTQYETSTLHSFGYDAKTGHTLTEVNWANIGSLPTSAGDPPYHQRYRKYYVKVTGNIPVRTIISLDPQNDYVDYPVTSDNSSYDSGTDTTKIYIDVTLLQAPLWNETFIALDPLEYTEYVLPAQDNLIYTFANMLPDYVTIITTEYTPDASYPNDSTKGTTKFHTVERIGYSIPATNTFIRTISNVFTGGNYISTSLSTNTSDKFGYSLATNYDGSKLFVGAPYRDFLDPFIADVGVVFAFSRVKQQFQIDFTPPLDNQSQLYLDFIPGDGTSLLLNGKTLASDRYALGTYSGKLYYKVSGLVAGDIITVDSPNFILDQELTSYENADGVIPGQQFGKSISCNSSGSEVIIGCPHDLTKSGQEGAVYRFTHEGKKYGTITSLIGADSQPNMQTTYILLNGYNVQIPVGDAYVAANAINAKNIQNVIAYVYDTPAGDNLLRIRLLNKDLGAENNKLDIIAFTASGATTEMYELGIAPYIKTQVIREPHAQDGSFFGEHVKFNEANSFVVTAPHATSYLSTTFDFVDSKDSHNNIVFDNNLTIFEDNLTNAGAAYIFEYIPTYNESLLNAGQYVYAQSCNDITIDYGADPLYGASVDFNHNILMIGSPKFKSDIAITPTTHISDGVTKSYSVTNELVYRDVAVLINNVIQPAVDPTQVYKNDGKNIFYQVSSVSTQSNVLVKVNGVRKVPSVDYIVRGTNLSFINKLNSGDIVEITELSTGVYRIENANIVFNVAPAKNAIIKIEENLHIDNLGYSSANGKVTIYQNKDKITDWHVYRQPTTVVDLDRIQKVQFYNNIDDSNLDSLDYFDPLNGKLLGAVRNNLDFISNSDPAGYNSANYVNKKLVWGVDQIGKVWFNTTNTKFLNYHQDDLSYNSKYWGNIFPGSTVTVYTWTENDVPPMNYAGNGSVLDIEKYVIGYVINSNHQLVTKYYYWVRNTNTLVKGKTLTDTVLESYIANPQNSGISYFAPLNQSTFALYNSRDYIHGKQTNLHLGFSTGVSEAPLRAEFKLIRENFAEDFLSGFVDPIRGYTTPSGLYGKMLDSFAGDDLSGQVVPDLNLPSYMRTGVSVRPRQSLFVDRFTALKNYLEHANTVMMQYPISELSNLTFLSTQGDHFDTTKYWSYVYYWETGYSDSTKTSMEVNIYPDLLRINATEDMVVGVRFNSKDKREVYAYANGSWNRVGLQDGTIQFNSALWDYTNSRIGYGDSFFDSTPFDEYPSTETRYIIRALNEQIFTGSLLEYRNESLILLFEYIQSENTLEHNYLPWLNKTSFIDVDYIVRPLQQETKYQRDNDTLISGYVDEIKPYHSVVKDLSFKYTVLDSTESTITDFDLPAIYNSSVDRFQSPKIVYSTPVARDNEYLPTATVWSDLNYTSWYQNYGLTLIDIPNQNVALLTKYVSLTDNVLYVDNARGLPVTGTLYIEGEAIGYNSVDRDSGLVSGITRGVENTTPAIHYPGTTVSINLPAVIVLDTGRLYIDPPTVTAYVDTTIYPAPTTPAVLQAVMSGDKVASVIVLDPGAGYVTTPEIVFSSSYDVNFDETKVNLTSHTILVPTTVLQTGDLIRSISSDSSHSSIMNGYYYVYVVATIENEELIEITLHKSLATSLKGEAKLIFNSNASETTTYTFSLTARAVPQTTNTLVRGFKNTLRFDRTSYVSKLIEWKPSVFYSTPFNSSSTEASQNTLLSYSTPYTNLSGTGGNGTGAVFTVYNVLMGGNYAVDVTTSGNHYHINDTITITGSHLAGANTTNDCVITVTALKNTYIRQNADTYSGTTGSNALFTIVSNGISYTVTNANSGLGYLVGDTFVYSGIRFNGATPANDITITITSGGVTSSGAIKSDGFSVTGTPAANGSIDTVSVTGIAVDAYLASLDGVVMPITNSSANTDGNTLVTLNYGLSGVHPGQIKNTDIYFYRVLPTYVYDDTTNGGAKIEIHRPRFEPTQISNRYFIKILDHGSIYNDTTQNKIVISGVLLGGVAGINDAIINVKTGELTGNNPLKSATISGTPVGLFTVYYATPINDTQVQLFKDSGKQIPVPFAQYIYTHYQGHSSSPDYAYIPEPIHAGEGYVYDMTSTVTYNGSIYRCLISNNDTTFDSNKWLKITTDDPSINALDRIITYYKPAKNMQPKDLQQLVKGISYPHDVYYGNSFSPEDVYPLDVVLKGQQFYPRDVSIKSMIYDGSNYVALAESSVHSSVLVSSDGINWNNYSLSNTTLGLTSLNYNTDHKQYILTDTTKLSPLLLSHDLENWLGVGQSTNYGMTPYDDNNFDSSPIVCPPSVLNSIVYTQGYYYAAGDKIVKSVDGVVWETVATFTSQFPIIINSLENVVSTFYDGFIAVGETTVWNNAGAASTATCIIVSVDGDNWVNTGTNLENISLRVITNSPDVIVVAGDNGSIYYGSNATNWSKASNSNDNTLRGGVYGNSKIILVGDNGTILTSTDGINWTDASDSNVTTSNLYTALYDDTYYYVAGDNGTILQSSDGVTWLNTSYIGQPSSDITPIEKLPYSTVKGSDFLFGYGPEEMIPGLMTDALSMTVITAPGSYWDDTASISGQLVYENTGFNMISKIATPISRKVSFVGIVLNPAQISVFVMDIATKKGYRIYEQSSANSTLSYTVDWVKKEITLSNDLSVGKQISIEVYEIGNGKEYYKASTDYVPLRTNTDGNSYIQVDVEYKPVVASPVVYANGVQLVIDTDYSIDFAFGTTAYTIITFHTTYDQEMDYIVFALLDSSLNEYNTVEYLFSIPETQLFTGSATDTFVLTNYITNTYDLPTDDNITNAVVEINGYRQDPASYTITVGDPLAAPNDGTLVFNSPVSSDDLVAITTFHETNRLYLKTLVWTSPDTYTVQDLFYYGVSEFVKYTDVNKVWLTINGARVEQNCISYYTDDLNQNLVINTTINTGDQIIATVMAKGYSPNTIKYTLELDKHGDSTIYRTNEETTTWLTQDLLSVDTTIHLYDVSKVIDSGTTKGIIKIGTEKIRYSSVDLVHNTLGGITRGVLGTSTADLLNEYTTVYGYTETNKLDSKYYNLEWNSNNINTVEGDPLQLSTSPVANFLKYGQY